MKKKSPTNLEDIDIITSLVELNQNPTEGYELLPLYSNEIVELHQNPSQETDILPLYYVDDLMDSEEKPVETIEQNFTEESYTSFLYCDESMVPDEDLIEDNRTIKRKGNKLHNSVETQLKKIKGEIKQERQLSLWVQRTKKIFKTVFPNILWRNQRSDD